MIKIMFCVLQYHAKVRFVVDQMVQHSGNGRSKINFKSLDKLMRNGLSCSKSCHACFCFSGKCVQVSQLVSQFEQKYTLVVSRQVPSTGALEIFCEFSSCM